MTAEEECGDLGVMPVPEGEDPSKYRKCLRHPLAGKHITEFKVHGTDHPAGCLGALQDPTADVGPPRLYR